MIYNQSDLGAISRNSKEFNIKEEVFKRTYCKIPIIDNCVYDFQQKDLRANSSRDCLQAQNAKEPPPMQKVNYIKRTCSSKIIKMVLITQSNGPPGQHDHWDDNNENDKNHATKPMIIGQ